MVGLMHLGWVRGGGRESNQSHSLAGRTAAVCLLLLLLPRGPAAPSTNLVHVVVVADPVTAQSERAC
jgi:hypothetical protein